MGGGVAPPIPGFLYSFPPGFCTGRIPGLWRETGFKPAGLSMCGVWTFWTTITAMLHTWWENIKKVIENIKKVVKNGHKLLAYNMRFFVLWILWAYVYVETFQRLQNPSQCSNYILCVLTTAILDTQPIGDIPIDKVCTGPGSLPPIGSLYPPTHPPPPPALPTLVHSYDPTALRGDWSITRTTVHIGRP